MNIAIIEKQSTARKRYLQFTIEQAFHYRLCCIAHQRSPKNRQNVLDYFKAQKINTLRDLIAISEK